MLMRDPAPVCDITYWNKDTVLTENDRLKKGCDELSASSQKFLHLLPLAVQRQLFTTEQMLQSKAPAMQSSLRDVPGTLDIIYEIL